MLTIIKSTNKMILDCFKEKHLYFHNMQVRTNGKFCLQTVWVLFLLKFCELSHDNLDSWQRAMKYMSTIVLYWYWKHDSHWKKYNSKRKKIIGQQVLNIWRNVIGASDVKCCGCLIQTITKWNIPLVYNPGFIQMELLVHIHRKICLFVYRNSNYSHNKTKSKIFFLRWIY